MQLESIRSSYYWELHKLGSIACRIGEIEFLKYLNAKRTNVSELPVLIGCLSKLVELDLSYNNNLETLPDTICNLRTLEVLSINDCKGLKALPIEFGSIETLKNLNAEGLTVLNFPDSIGRLSNLVEMILSYSNHLESLPDIFAA